MHGIHALRAPPAAGALPFFFVKELSTQMAGLATAVACGVMFACSFDLVHSGEGRKGVASGADAAPVSRSSVGGSMAPLHLPAAAVMCCPVLRFNAPGQIHPTPPCTPASPHALPCLTLPPSCRPAVRAAVGGAGGGAGRPLHPRLTAVAGSHGGHQGKRLSFVYMEWVCGVCVGGCGGVRGQQLLLDNA